jgi:hypothetical protein
MPWAGEIVRLERKNRPREDPSPVAGGSVVAPAELDLTPLALWDLGSLSSSEPLMIRAPIVPVLYGFRLALLFPDAAQVRAEPSRGPSLGVVDLGRPARERRMGCS